MRFTHRIKREIARAARRASSWRSKAPVSAPELTPKEIRRLVGRPDPVLLEIGAHDGSDTVRFLAAMPRAHVDCFEPDPRPLARLIERLGRDPRVSIHPLAIGATDGRAVFHQSDGTLGDYPHEWDYSGSIHAPKTHLLTNPEVLFTRRIEVDVMRLDDWAAARGVTGADFIWMDTQGAEGDVIAGGGETLARTRFVYTEYSDDEAYEGQIPLAEILRRLPGFEIVTRYPYDVLLRNTRL